MVSAFAEVSTKEMRQKLRRQINGTGPHICGGGNCGRDDCIADIFLAD